jgi:Xaa-Pro aminopeptidase
MGKETGKEILQNLAVEALFLTGAAAMRYLAGFTGEGYVYLSKRQAVVVTDSRYTIAAGKECPEFSVTEWKSGGYYTPLQKALKEDRVSVLGIEDEVMTLSRNKKMMDALEKDGLKVETKAVSAGLKKYRAVKTEDEIRKIEIAESISDRAFEKLIPVLKKGMTEKQVAAWLEFFMKEEGADGFSFETIAASGIHSAMPHARPTDKVLEEGDFLTMDFGCSYEGYCSDMTRTVVIGKADEKKRKIYNLVLTAQQAALDGIRPGMTGKEIDALARAVIEKEGYGKNFGHSLGHSLGLEIHESPCFSPTEETVISPGMVITVEPGVYIEQVGGVRIEDVVVITDKGCRNLTRSPKELIEIHNC